MVVAPEEEAASNGTDLYTLSVVRLADPLHAQLQLLNVTESTGETYTLCGDSSGLEGPPVLGSNGLVDYEVPQASWLTQSDSCLSCSPLVALAEILQG